VGPVYQAGTLSGHPVVMAAGIATLEQLDDALYAQLEEIGAELEAGLRKALPEARIARVGSLLTVFVADFPALFRRLRQGGILLPPSQFEAWFLSAAHGEEEVSRTWGRGSRSPSARPPPSTACACQRAKRRRRR